MTKVQKTKAVKAASKQSRPGRKTCTSHVTAKSVTKAARILAMLGRARGATLDDLMKETGWQQHSLRGYLSGTIGKRLGYTISSVKSDGQRCYRIEGKGELS